jgi:ankyrin repeat protein
MPDTTPPGKPHFDTLGAKVGEQVPGLPVHDLNGEVVQLDQAWQGRTTLLITSSYTCPKSRSTYPTAAALAAKLKDKLNVAIIYVIEAHPSGDPSPYSGVEDVTNENRLDHVLCAQPRTLDERLALAKKFQKRLEISVPIYVDSMDNAAWKSLGGGPNMGVLVDEHGIVLARQGWFDADSMKKAADAILAAMPADRKNVTTASSYTDFDDARPTEHGDLEKVKAQIAKTPALVTKVFPYMARGGEGDKTLLHYAIGPADANGRHLAIVELLVNSGADVNKQTEHVPTPLHLAAKDGNLAIAKFLIGHGADVNAKAHGNGPTPLQEALIYGHADVAALLVKSGAKSNFYTDIASGNIEAVRAKVNKDSSIVNRPDGWSRPPLVYAAAAGQLDMAKFLIGAGARELYSDHYWYSDRIAIDWAVKAKNVPMVRLLCENGSDPNLLDEAIRLDARDVARELLAHKADPNAEDLGGDRPLHNAAIWDRPEIAQILIDSGANPNAPTGPDRHPCGPGYSEFDLPLNMAAREGSARTMAVLLRAGAKIDAPNEEGHTPLQCASGSYLPPAKILPAIQLLVEAKADINLKDSQGETALDYAMKAARTADIRDDSVVNYLGAHGAKAGADVPGENGIRPPHPLSTSRRNRDES